MDAKIESDLIDFNVMNHTKNQENILNCTFKYNSYKYSSIIPIFIINKDRLYSLKILMSTLLSLKSIYNLKFYILDHYSSYLPTINYYKYLSSADGVTIIKLKTKKWDDLIAKELPLLIMEISKSYKAKYYVISDSDICIKFIPKDFLNFYLYILENCKSIDGVGPHITVSNLPNFYPRANHFFMQQTKYTANMHFDIFWKRNFYSLIKIGYDTTLHIRRSNILFKRFKGNLFRSLPPYSVLHTDWYINKNNVPKSYIYYINGSKNINHSYWK